MKQALLLTIAAIFSNQASAVVLDFNELATDNGTYYFKSYSSNGFSISNSDNSASALGVWGKNSSYQADTGNAAIFVNWSNTTTTLKNTANLPFSFVSIALADVHNDGINETIEFTFTNVANQNYSQSVTLDQLRGLQTFTFNQQNLKQVSWKNISRYPGWNQFDNIQVAPVPEPETYALMGMGLVGLLAARRRKAKQA